MTEDAHILSIQQLFTDYTKGIVHNECYRQAFYDDGDDVVEVERFDDISEAYEADRAKRNNKASTQSSTSVEQSIEGSFEPQKEKGEGV